MWSIRCGGANEARDILGHRFTDFEILTRAFTSAAFIKEERERLKEERTTIDAENQGALATPGDAVLKVALTDIVFHSGPKNADQITKERIEREKGSKIAAVAREQGFWPLMRLGGSEKRLEDENRESILATTIEAVLGALYIDTGYDLGKTKEVFGRYF